ncbi:MAG: hypothetical protein ACREJQ_04885, partial [bacterium]
SGSISGTRKLPQFQIGTHVQTIEGLTDHYLQVGKHRVKCRSEYEARYLAVCVQCFIEEAKVPKADKLLTKIVPELEREFARVSKILSSELKNINQPKLRAQVARALWHRLLNSHESPT